MSKIRWTQCFPFMRQNISAVQPEKQSNTQEREQGQDEVGQSKARDPAPQGQKPSACVTAIVGAVRPHLVVLPSAFMSIPS